MMKRRTRKLLCLNLSLVLLLSLAAIPVSATGDSDVLCPMESGCADDFAQSAHIDALTAVGEQGGDDPSPAQSGSVALSGTDAFAISVGGVRFASSQEASGKGWTYSPIDHSLTLNGYSGSKISASGDLVIYTNGNCKITGNSGKYGGNALESVGNLDVYVQSGTLSVTAGSGSVSGGNAVWVSGVFYCSCNGTASFTGGKSTGTQYRGGDALSARDAVILNGSGITATGGSASTSSTYGLSGGCAIWAPEVSIYADCTLKGGAAYYGGPAVYFTSYCQFGIVNASVSSGGKGFGAILSPGGQMWYYHPHTTLTGYNDSFKISVNRYTLSLDGNGGRTWSGKTFTSLNGYYPAKYYLDGFSFDRDGYTQVAWGRSPGELQSAPIVQETWTDASLTPYMVVWETWTESSLIPYNETYIPTKDITLYAKWVRTGANDILLNGLWGAFSDGTTFRKTTASSVKLPDALSYLAENGGSPTISDDGKLIEIRPSYKNKAVLVWTDAAAASSDELHIYKNAPFYVGSDVVTPNASAATVLYAWENDGLFARYHATLGTLRQGGSILLQGESSRTVASATSLTTYVPDDSYLIAPENYEFSGWSLRNNAKTADYLPGDPITLRRNVTDLYAVWTPTQKSTKLADGVTLTQKFKEDRFILSASAQWCQSSGTQTIIFALYDGGKLVRSVLGTASAQGISLSLPYQAGSYKIFALDAQQRPTCSFVSFGIGGGAGGRPTTAH